MPRAGIVARAALATLIGSASFGLAAQETPPAPTREDGGSDKKKDRLGEPWPSAEELRERQVAAEELPLFKSAEPLAFTLKADFKGLKQDRVVDSPKRFPGVLTVSGEGGRPVAIPVQVSTRGHLRLNPRVCSFPPLRLQFTKQNVRGTVFESQGSLKLVTHCKESGDYEQHLLGEALAYRIANILTPDSFRARVARASYVESSSGKPLTTRRAILIEDDSDLARRMQGRMAPLEKRLFRNLDQPSLLRMTVFQAMIGNTDFSIHALHNVRLIQDREGALRPVAYDFDSSGLVSPPYAAPDPRLGISSVRERRYRGPCVPIEELEPTLADLRAKKQEVLALYDGEAELTDTHRRTAKDYLKDFFDLIGSKRRSKILFVERCSTAVGM